DIADFFAEAAVSRSGRVAVAWRGTDGSRRPVRVSMSKDHGRTWSAPRNWSGSESTATSPWVGFRDDRNLDVLWYQGLAAPVSLVLSRGPADGYPTQRAVVAIVQPTGGRSAGNTDY